MSKLVVRASTQVWDFASSESQFEPCLELPVTLPRTGTLGVFRRSALIEGYGSYGN